jgi:predicted dehydrogenase
MNTEFGLSCLGTTHPHVSVRLDVARRIEGIKLISVTDRDPANIEGLAALSRHLEVKIQTPEEMLNDPEVHAVIVEPWTYEMVDATIQCIEAGKHVLVDKPGGSNPDDLERMVTAQQASNQVVQIGYNFRFSPMIEFAKEVLEKELLGKVVQAQVHAAGPAGDAVYRWFNLPNDLGGCFWEDGCHIMDLILHLFGLPNSVSAKISKFKNVSDDSTLEDAALAALEWDNMALAFDFTSWEANDWLETWQFNIYGTEGTLRFQMCPQRYELYLKEKKDRFEKGWNRWDEKTFATPWAGEPTPWEEWHIVANKSFFFNEISTFRDTCLNNKSSVIPPKQAQDIAVVMAACYESSRSGKSVEI